MPEHDALRELARRCGVASGYHDIWGHYHEPDQAVLRELLLALGVLAAPDEDPAQAARRWDDAHWDQILPPVRVLRQGQAADLPVILAEDKLDRALSYRIVQEDGHRHDGAFHPAHSPARGEYTRDGRRLRAVALILPPELPLGYHRLALLHGERVLAETLLVQAPSRCYQPPELEQGARLWGPAVQLYAVRSERNWGMGDFTDLRRLAEQWAEQGAQVIGLNPLHALFLGNPAHCSPYSPSSRRFLNSLYLDVESIPEYSHSEPARALVRSAEFQLRLQALRAADRVDYPGVAAAKLAVLEHLYRAFREREQAGDSERAVAFRRFRAEGGEALRLYATFEALYEHFRAEAPNTWSWLDWPAAYQDPGGEAVRRFAQAQAERVEFFEYLQWQADAQLATVAEQLREQGLAVGLYLDLAVSVDRGGADGWRNQDLYAPGVRVGAPPDDFNRRGQDWGLPPFDPHRLRQAGYQAFIGALRESMCRAGALRIDHVMGLMRLYWIPPGQDATRGAYVGYPFEELLGITALESQRNRCLVIGEDLGTVPDAVRQAMSREHMLSYRVLFFEQEEAGFKAPADYPARALASVSTHDLPTLAGYWQGEDLTLRGELELFDSEETRGQAVVERSRDRSRLLLALEQQGLLPEGMSADPVSAPRMNEPLIRAIHAYLARGPSQLMMVQPEDVLGMVEQVNLPGAPEERHPHWRRKLALSLEQWPEHAGFLRLSAALRELRPLPATQSPGSRPATADIPRATYRLQLNSGFTIRDATVLIPYLSRLGVSHVYCSPYLRARAGSQHGYDIIDHNAHNPEIGTPEDFRAFAEELAAHGMGQILDIVPNHMGVMGADNQWWLDVLENGPAALHAPYFDIDWRPAKLELRDKLLVPTLGDGYGDVLERGELALRFDEQAGAFSVWYHEHRLPIAPGEYPRLLGHRLETLELRLGVEEARLLELKSLISAFGHLPGRQARSPGKLLERHRDLQLHKQRLARLCQHAPQILEQIRETVVEYNGRPGEPDSFDALHQLLEAQPYRLAHWHAAADEINYRRFFDIHDLAGLRMEDPRVFEATHQLILKLVGDGQVQGLRIDHPDGLYDPRGYFRRLQQRAGKPLYLLVEKILATDERLPADWPVHGTTGYEFANLVNGLFVDDRHARGLQRFYAAFTGERLGFDEQVYKAKRLIMKYALASELNVLANELNRMSEADRHTRDFTLNRLRVALAEVVAWLPVYRTYEREGAIADSDRRYIEQAVARARAGTQAEEVGVYDFLRRVLLREGLSEAAAERARDFAMRLQQYTGAVMAKGLEDTSFYRYLPLASLNEVGGDPRRFGVSVADFHTANCDRREHWPHSMLATSTHDNKRSEDVRARISVLSELPALWRGRVRAWSAINARHRRGLEGGPAPSRNDEYLLYQTLLGAWPPGLAGPAGPELVARIQAYMLKAGREAKQHSSWINQNPDYEQASAEFVAAVMTDASFLADFLPLQRRVHRLGLYNSLSQTLLKLTAPGVPDIYQGNELCDYSLVDPDNRRPVDYRCRAELLESLGGSGAPPDSSDGDRAKLFLTYRTLAVRGERETLFRDGEYQPLACSGPRAEHLCAFARRDGGETAIVVVPRLYATLLAGAEDTPLGAELWQDTVLALDATQGGRFANVYTGESVETYEHEGHHVLAIHQVLGSFPVALLISGH